MERILVRVQSIFKGDYCCGDTIEFIESLLLVFQHGFVGFSTGCGDYLLMDGAVDFYRPSSRLEFHGSLSMVVHTKFYTTGES